MPSNIALDLAALRARLQSMTTPDLERFGRTARYMASRKAAHGRKPREVWKIQFVEARLAV